MQQSTDRLQDIHVQFVTYGAHAKEWLRKCALLLPEIHRQRIWEKKGFGSVFEYAGKLAGMSRSAVEEALWVVGRVEDKPALLRVIEEKGISAVRPVASIATVTSAEFWAEKAKGMSVSALQAYVHEVKRGRVARDDVSTGNNPHLFFDGDLPDVRQNQLETIEVTMQLSRELGEQLEKMRDGGSWEELLKEFLLYREKVLEMEQPQAVEDAERHIPGEIVKFVIRRSRGLCEFGACRKIYEILHHTQRFALEKVHDPARIVALCKAHERVVHMGLVRDERVLPREWQVLASADVCDERYEVDRVVQKYRDPG